MGFLSSFAKALKSKTVWGAIASGALAAGPIIPAIAPYVPAGPGGAALGLAAAAFTIYGRVKAKQPLGPVIDQTIKQTVDAVHQLQGEMPASAQQPAPPKPPLSMVTALVKSTAPLSVR